MYNIYNILKYIQKSDLRACCQQETHFTIQGVTEWTEIYILQKWKLKDTPYKQKQLYLLSGKKNLKQLLKNK